MTRRRRLIIACMLSALLALCAIVSCAPRSDMQSRIRAFERRYGVDIEAVSIPFSAKLTGRRCEDEDQIGRLLDALEGVLSRYPASLSRVARLRKIYLCAELTSFVTPVAGVTANAGDQSDVYVSAAFLTSADYLSRTLHHELFHAIEFAHPVDDASWRAANPYEPFLEDVTPKGKVIYYDAVSAPPFEPGFVSEYGRVRPREDRAELFAFLMQPRSLTPGEQAMLGGDRFLREKIQCLRDYLDGIFAGGGFAWDEAMDAAPTLYAQQLYTAKPGAVIREGPSDAYPAVSAPGVLFYLGKSRSQDGKRLMALLDGSGQRVYAREKDLAPLPAFDCAAELDGVGVTLDTSPTAADGIGFEPLPGGRIDPNDALGGGMLAAAACAELVQALESAEEIPLSRFAPVANLMDHGNPIPALLVKGTLYADVKACTGKRLQEALGLCKR